MEKLAELLNDLLRMWWKPFNRNKTLHINYYDKCKWLNYKWIHLDGWFMNEESRTLRELVSKESWLWQFVCENELVKPVVDIISICSYSHFTDDHDDGGWDETFPEYRLIEASLKDESELEQFLLDNIKVEW